MRKPFSPFTIVSKKANNNKLKKKNVSKLIKLQTLLVRSIFDVKHRLNKFI